MFEVISLEDLKKLIDENGDYILIDVREKDELENGMIPTAINIPLFEVDSALYQMDEGEFKEKYGIEKPNKDDNIIMHCRTGSRSAQAASILLSLGYKNVKNFEGSIWAWADIDENVKRYGPEPI